MGKTKPSILTGLFSHLSMNKRKKNTDYDNLRQISPKSKPNRKNQNKKRIDKGKQMVSNMTKKNVSNKSQESDNILLCASECNTPEKLLNSKKSSKLKNVKKVLNSTKRTLMPNNSYEEITESPVCSMDATNLCETKSKPKPPSLREKMLNKLKAARFRYLNEQLYVSESAGAKRIFSEDPLAFKAYHEGYQLQVNQWPINPLDVIIQTLIKKNSVKTGKAVVADMGCGEARLAQTLPCTVHSIDLVAVHPRVIACDMSHTPLHSGSVDLVVFCLSLMGTNIVDYVREANRMLKEGGVVKIAEIESRFEDLENFIKGIERMGFKIVSQDLSHNLFYFLDFKKQSNVSKKKKKKIPELSLKPCFYKKR